MSSDPNSGEIKAFSNFIAMLNDGDLHHDLTSAIENVIAALNDARQNGTSKPKASMTIKLAFCLDGQTVDVSGDFDVKTPKVKRERSVFWTTAANRLSRNNPQQQNLPFRDVTASASAIVRDVSGNTPVKAV